MIPYAKHSISSKEIRACVKVLKAGFLSQGPQVPAFEKSFQHFCGVPHAVAVSSGTAALHLACQAAAFGEGQEVVVPAMTFVATANAVMFCGARPVFADIDLATGNVTVESIGRALTPKTRGIIVVHFGGQPVDLAPIAALAKERRLMLIEDACHAVGAEYQKGRIGNAKFSDLCAFSFHPAKNMTTGEGGMVTTRDPRLAQKVRDLRNHGLVRDPDRWENTDKAKPAYYEMQELGLNYRLTDLQCAIGIEQLKRLPVFNKKRKKIACLYQNGLGGLPGIHLLEEKWGTSCWHIFVIRVTPDSGWSRDELIRALRDRGIGTSVQYIPVPSHPYYQRISKLSEHTLPCTLQWAEEAMCLPIFPDLRQSDVNKIIRTIRTLVRSGPPSPAVSQDSMARPSS